MGGIVEWKCPPLVYNQDALSETVSVDRIASCDRMVASPDYQVMIILIEVCRDSSDR